MDIVVVICVLLLCVLIINRSSSCLIVMRSCVVCMSLWSIVVLNGRSCGGSLRILFGILFLVCCGIVVLIWSVRGGVMMRRNGMVLGMGIRME